MDFGRAESALSQLDSAALCAELAALYPHDPDLDKLNDLVRFALVAGAPMPRLAGPVSAFVAAIAATRNFWLGTDLAARAGHRIARRVIPATLDFLGEWKWPKDWSAAQALNFLLMNRIAPSRRAAVVGTMRDDGLYALEWIAHHIALGFEGIFIYTNDNADGSEILLRRLADHGVITLVESETSGTVRPEVKAFEHALHLMHELRDHEWVLFVDSDEFLQLSAGYQHSVNRLLDAVDAHFSGEAPSAVLFEWLWCNSGMVYQRQPGLLMERFQHASQHWVVKPLVRLRDVESMRMQHIPALRHDGFLVDSSFARLDPDQAQKPRPPQYAGGRINHYWTKSFEEFSLKKARGDAIKLADARFRDEYMRDFALFFEWNGPETPETHWPVDPVLLADVKRTLRRLRALDGVAAIEAEVQARFSTLVARYDAEGGLQEIYRRLHSTPTRFGVPASA